MYGNPRIGPISIPWTVTDVTLCSLMSASISKDALGPVIVGFFAFQRSTLHLLHHDVLIPRQAIRAVISTVQLNIAWIYNRRKLLTSLAYIPWWQLPVSLAQLLFSKPHPTSLALQQHNPVYFACFASKWALSSSIWLCFGCCCTPLLPLTSTSMIQASQSCFFVPGSPHKSKAQILPRPQHARLLII